MKTWPRRLALAFVAVGVAVWLSGCLSTKYFAMVRYDPAKDEFTVLNVYQRIIANQPGDSQYLYQLWRNRDHLIRVPNIDILTMPAYLRMSARQYAPINLGDAPPKLEPVDTPVALDEIRVRPGAFFLRGPDTLCYYDQVTIPGKVIDQALPLLVKSVAPGMTAEIDKEIQRRKNGGQTVEWAKYRQDLVRGLHSASNAATAPASKPADSEPRTDPIQVLDDLSLELLCTCAADGRMKLAREKQVLRFTLPLSNPDARQVNQTWLTLLDAAAADVSKGSPDDPTFAFVASKLRSAFKLSVHPNAVQLDIDGAIIIEHLPELASITKPLGEPTEQELKLMRDTIASLRAQGAPIDETITVEQLARDFMTDSVKSYPSEHPVEPGNGMVQTPPAKK